MKYSEVILEDVLNQTWIVIFARSNLESTFREARTEK